MKPKLTKAQMAKAKRAVVSEIGYPLRKAHVVGWCDASFDHRVYPEAIEYAECVRLLRVALKAVRGA